MDGRGGFHTCLYQRLSIKINLLENSSNNRLPPVPATWVKLPQPGWPGVRSGILCAPFPLAGSKAAALKCNLKILTFYLTTLEICWNNLTCELIRNGALRGLLPRGEGEWDGKIELASKIPAAWLLLKQARLGSSGSSAPGTGIVIGIIACAGARFLRGDWKRAGLKSPGVFPLSRFK